MSRQKGFTLIEIIIVITIIGLLAVALLAALDPVEQFNKGRDTSAREIVRTLAGAYERYRSTLGVNPAGTPNASSSLTVDTVSATFISALVNSGELKSNFAATVGTTTLSKIGIVRGADNPDGSQGTVYFCHKPTSKAYKMQGGQYYLLSGGGATNAVLSTGQQVSTTPGIGNPVGLDCQAVSATGPTNREYCVYCLPL